MRTYELFLDENVNRGVFAISLVNDPAMESDWVALSKDVKLAVVDDDKHILMGAALIPDKKVTRSDEDGIFEVFFSEETVRKASELFLKNSFQSETTLEHQIDLNTNTVVESWIKEDPVHDKSVKFNIDVPVGSWMISMKIEDDELYKKAKGGSINGFSIEGGFSDMLIKNKTESVTDEKSKGYNDMDEKKFDISKGIKEILEFVKIKPKSKSENMDKETKDKIETIELSKHEEKVSELNASIETQKTEHEEKVVELNKEIETLKEKETSQEEKIVELQAKVDKIPDAEKVKKVPKHKEVNLSTAQGRILATIQNQK